MSQRNRLAPIVTLGILSEGCIVLAGLGVAAFFPIDRSQDPLRTSLWDWNTTSILWGVAGTVPLVVLFLLCDRYPVGPMKAIKRFLQETLGPGLRECRWFELILVAALAGFCEEFFFRGVLQPRIGLIFSNILFGLAHPITWLYALLAAVLGGYLGYLFDFSGNIWTPIVTHGVYDYLAFLILLRNLRAPASTPNSEPAETGGV